MTEAIDDTLAGYYLDEVSRVAGKDRSYLYGPSVLNAAAEALQGVQTALDLHDITDAFTRPLGSLASRILAASVERFDRVNFVPETDPDPVALLRTAAAFAADHLDRPVTPVDGPALAESRAEVAYVTLPRLPESPPWGQDGEAPLVVTLGRPDRAAIALIYSSGAWRLGDYEPGPWCWHLCHGRPGDLFIGSGTRLIVPEPSPESAAEVGALVADVLTGHLALRG